MVEKAAEAKQSTATNGEGKKSKEEEAKERLDEEVVKCFKYAEVEVGERYTDLSGVGHFLERYARRRLFQWLPLPDSVSGCMPEIAPFFEILTNARKVRSRVAHPSSHQPLKTFTLLLTHATQHPHTGSLIVGRTLKLIVVFLGFFLEAIDFAEARGAAELFNLYGFKVDTPLGQHKEIIQNALAFFRIGWFFLLLAAFPFKRWSANITDIILQGVGIIVFCNGIWEDNQAFAVGALLLGFWCAVVEVLGLVNDLITGYIKFDNRFCKKKEKDEPRERSSKRASRSHFAPLAAPAEIKQATELVTLSPLEVSIESAL